MLPHRCFPHRTAKTVFPMARLSNYNLRPCRKISTTRARKRSIDVLANIDRLSFAPVGLDAESKPSGLAFLEILIVQTARLTRNLQALPMASGTTASAGWFLDEQCGRARSKNALAQPARRRRKNLAKQLATVQVPGLRSSSGASGLAYGSNPACGSAYLLLQLLRSFLFWNHPGPRGSQINRQPCIKPRNILAGIPSGIGEDASPADPVVRGVMDVSVNP